MPKVKPAPYIAPSEEEPKDDQDEQEDEPEDQDDSEDQDRAQALGLLTVAADLTVLDFFAGMAVTSMAGTMGSKGVTDTDRAVVAERAYALAHAMLRTRARIESEELE